MIAQEREQLTRFLQQLAQAQVGAKDAEAERLIQETCNRQPDASYLLVQRGLLLDQALQNTQSEIARLQKELDRLRNDGGGSFLNTNSWGNTPVQSQAAQRAGAFAPPSQALTAPPATPGWGSGMLGTVATTAAGVVAGSFLFQGIESLIGHHGNSAGLLSANNTPPASHTPPENLVSNHTEDTSLPQADLDSLGPSDEDAGWA